ncbi:DMT family transporter [Stratiformator vulcanicus]|uniref:EamA-like transporter family protein n=1 Tax=Stratiformator vulcanicus TaxID=2527980 RepID=A0A517R4K7_9PLAN|nr:DMT family transporter [Stratiformator vulcanicus]QDT38818.1 EamA-like transporter family protein [Stratiformator vulcanicus]
MSWHLLYPLLSSVLYVFATLFIKRSGDLGVGVIRATVVTNVVTGVLALSLIPLGGTIPSLLALYQPLTVAALFVLGQVLIFWSLQIGDVSVATPALGAKPVLVALLAAFVFGREVGWQIWLAAVLSVVAISLLYAVGRVPKRRIPETLLLSLGAAGAYAMADVLLQQWAPAWDGAGRITPILFGFVALLSLPALPWMKPVKKDEFADYRPWLIAGAMFFGVQAMPLTYALATFDDASAINVVYSARGLWSVVFVWMLGHHFFNDERGLGMAVLQSRLAGAVLMTVAVVLALFR